MDNKIKIANRIIQCEATIIQCLKKMDDEKVKLLFVYNKEDFVGILTIGDIQRAIIANVDLNSPISIDNTNKVYATPNEAIEQIKEKMLQIRSECMPVVDNEGNLVNVFFWEELFENSQSIILPEKINIPVVIMAGGKGTRLKPLTNVIPKPLLPIGDKTILEIILDKFTQAGCSEFYMSVNYKSDLLKYYLENIPQKYNISYFEENEPLGTIGSVSLLKGRITTPFFVSNCDILIEQDLAEIYKYHIENENDITIITAIKTYQIPYGVIKSVENGIISELTEKPDLSYMINTGVYILQPNMIDEIPVGQFFHITHLIDKIRAKGGKVGCFPISENSWTDIGEWNEYLKLIK
ncbi:mannose-1-phosphate guanylyltransferase [Bacteroidia bacterium]|nr:mannose-1-phosphate guanylyltransferase [Bacteroidia bacterium]